ncbi:tldc domain-containing protein [Stylonychia lemnae]|uniref:Tldc domain-containing protein n=1 Tax=Stylonychia lemnae TaxID=5949 RepID=A0A077ZSZ6_STYLE|nr:tldc domain-containing protein [Stylonychia lemnae]|eukprot:CDW72679.1 tldc domain-containing protein [Stylonychia lemnae]
MQKDISLKIRDSYARYRLENPIAKGAFGSVYNAIDILDPTLKQVAFKQQDLHIKLKGCKDEDFSIEVLRLMREIASFQLRHPNIVEILDSYLTIDGKFIIISELADSDLTKYILKRRNSADQLSVSEISVIMLQLLDGLNHIHYKGFIHRDINPQNILVFKDNQFKIGDFGIASYGAQTQLRAGKEHYMAPEIKLDFEYDKSVDIWSLGILLYYLCTGEEKIQEKTVNSIRAQKKQVPLPPNYEQFQEMFDMMTAYDSEFRPSIHQLKEQFIKLIDDSSDYVKKQNTLLAYKIKSINDQLEHEIAQQSQFLQLHLNNVQLRYDYAIQKELNDLKSKIDQYKKIIQSFIVEPHLIYEEREQIERFYDEEKKTDKLESSIQKQIVLHQNKQQEFNRLVQIYIEEQDIQKSYPRLFSLQGKCILLYKGTIDGFKAKHFHQKCDNKGPTISFILSEHGQVFGGYSSVSWTSPISPAKFKDSDAFLFSLSKNTLHVQYKNFDNAVCHNKDQMMIFGVRQTLMYNEYNDICITDDCNNQNSSFCDIGCTYLPPKGLQYKEQLTKDYLAGTFNFKVIEIEVYQVLK